MQRALWCAVAAAVLSAFGTDAEAQVTYRNSDIGRPLRMEDAIPLDRYALDLHVSPVALAWLDGTRQWVLTPGATYGILPRTQADVSVPLASLDWGSGRRTGIAGVNLGALHNLMRERSIVPAVAVRGSVLLPLGNAGPESTHPALAVIGTRTLPLVRVHINAHYAFRDVSRATADAVRRTAAAGVVRWRTGVAVDRAFPRRSLLFAAETYATQPLDESQDAYWTVGAALRHQLTAAVTANLGLSVQVSGQERPWSLNLGLGRVTAIRSLLPGLGPWGRPWARPQ